MKHNIYDVIIVGGGIMGASTAYHLIKENPGHPSYDLKSTLLPFGENPCKWVRIKE